MRPGRGLAMDAASTCAMSSTWMRENT
ncbi:hypothetical protein RB2654_14740 [Rhodobacterales bacterium HTCC2654]|uniref:Uncharacterized protein n=1 Tax=Maritimibacter alkaliphilus HTCC2654 TaxID=314271 RepID=A3VGZ7_9RHOB|nr:hypothetical protein RB2654_14740 [Rhodobacterales bacterium HTCC2654] [Maritimibacter alkaliphilus HTCC2654]